MLINPLRIHAEFTDWPLHITIVPWFRTEVASHELAEKIVEQLKGIVPFQVTVGNEAHFGYRKSKQVSLLEPASELFKLEKSVRAVLHEYRAWIADETTKRRRPFQPHITAQKIGRVYEGDIFTIDCVSVIEQKGDHKAVVSEVRLAYEL